MLLAYWVHDLAPFVIQFTEDFGIRWYGLSYAAGFVIAYYLLRLAWRFRRSPLAPDQLDTLFLALVIGVLVGGRLGSMLLYDFDAFVRNPLIFFRFWQGGMASHGGFVGVFLAILWTARHYQVSPFALGDAICAAAPPGIFLGRIANFINGELWGRPTDAPWAVIFPRDTALDPTKFHVFSEILGRYVHPRHPSQLYAAVLEGLVLFAFIQHRFWRTPPEKRLPGRIAGEFLIAYAVLRILSEVYREPDAPLISGLSRGTFYSLLTLAAGVAVLLWARYRPSRYPWPGHNPPP